MLFTLFVWLVMLILLFGTVQLMAYWHGRDADDVAGWVALGAVAVALARREVKK